MRWVTWLILPLWISSASVALAEDEPAKSSGVLERIGNTAKKVGNKIEQKLNKAANKTAEGFKKAGDKIDKKLNH